MIRPAASSTQTPTSFRIVLPFYLTASVFFILVCVLCWSNTALFLGHYFQPHLLAITHLAVLGWLCMMVFGASHQLVPVLAERPLYRESLAWISYGALLTGSLWLGYAFYTFAVGPVMEAGALLVLVAFVAFTINMLHTMKGHAGESFQLECLRTACYWLLFTGVLGTTLVFNLRYAFLPKGQVFYLGLHAHAGLLGWFLLLIMAVASRLLPMFLLSTYNQEHWLKWAYGAVNVGLLVLVVETLVLRSLRTWWVAAACIVLGLGCFGMQVKGIYQHALRKKKDAALRMTAVALGLLGIPVILLGLMLAEPQEASQLSLALRMAYGWSILGCFLSALVMAQTFKTLPFIVWMHRHQKEPSLKQLQPKDLYRERNLYLLFISYLLAIAAWLGGILMQDHRWLECGGWLLSAASIWYAWNVIGVATGWTLNSSLSHGTSLRSSRSERLSHS